MEYINEDMLEKEKSRFKCQQCGRCYRHAGSLANHKKVHEVGSFHCPFCTRVLSNALALKNHLRIHANRKSFSCAVCGKAFRLSSQLIAHHAVHRSQGSHKESVKKNKLEAKTPREANGERVDSEPNYVRVENFASTEFDVVCKNNTDMTESFNADSSADKQKHLTTDSIDRPFKCDQCEKTYRHHGSLINHKKSHQLGSFECHICCRLFNNLAALNSHQRTHSKSKSKLSPAKVSSQTLEAVPDFCLSTSRNESAAACYCHSCKMFFPNKSDLQEHILLHRMSSSIREFSEGYSMSDLDSFVHSKMHFSPSPQTLDAPEAGEHTNGQVYTCAYCEEEYSDLEKLKDHYLTHNSPSGSSSQANPLMLDSKHFDYDVPAQESESAKEAGAQKSISGNSEDRRFKCQICGKSYRHAGSLVNHKRSHQTGSYQCSICCKYYPHLAALHSHLRSHRTRPQRLPLNTEGDWLSSEPLTLELQPSYYNNQEQENNSPVSENVRGISQTVYDVQNEIPEQFGISHSEEGLEHTLLPSSDQPVEVHMCADCGETYRDITGMKSHLCPQQYQRQEQMSNGFLANDKFQDLGEEHLRQNCRNLRVIRRDKPGDLSNKSSNNGRDEHNKDETEEDDGEVYQCSVCGNHYTSLRALKSHLRGNAHFQGTPTSTDFSSLSSTDDENWRGNLELESGLMICSICGESFFKKNDLQAHQLLHTRGGVQEVAQSKTHNTYGADEKMEEKSHICGKCGMFCVEYNEMEAHRCHAEGKAERGERLNMEEDLEKKADHKSDRPHRCDQCGRTYRHPSSLLNHKKSHKTGVFRCFVCQKRFYNLLALKGHHRTHFDLKRHKCDICGKAFKIQKQLANHLKIHMDDQTKVQQLMHAHQTEIDQGVECPPSSIVSKRKAPRCKQTTAMCRKCGEMHSVEKSCHECGIHKELEAVRLEETQKILQPHTYEQHGQSCCHAGTLEYRKNSHKTGDYNCGVCTSTYSKQHTSKNHLQAVKKCPRQKCRMILKGPKQLSNHEYSCSEEEKLPGSGHAQPLELRQLKGGQRFRRSMDQLSIQCHIKASDSSVPSKRHLSDFIEKNATDDHVFPQKEDRPFVCDICNRTYRHAGSLLNHKNTHKTGNFSCSFCSKPFANTMALRNHVRIHTQTKKHVCSTCGKAFRLASVLLNHQKVHAQKNMHFNCPTCGRTFLGKSGLERHRCGKNQKVYRKENGRKTSTKARGEDEQQNRFKCEQCGRSYRHASSLINHRSSHTTGIYHCTPCLKTFSNLLALKNHRRIHSEVRRYSCPDCHKCFRASSQLRSHSHVHRKRQELFCNTCQQSFYSRSSFRKHQELPCQAQQLPQQDMSEHSELDLASRIDIALTHAQGLDLNGRSRPTTVFPCMQSILPMIEDRRESPAETVQRAHVCEHCGRTYRHASSLLNHKNSHKMGLFICSTCNKEFSNLMALKNHRRIHTEPKRYVCSDCGKAFRVSTQLICHRRVHTKEKPYSCTHCSKNFSSKSNLRHHQKVHKKNMEASLNVYKHISLSLI